MRARPSRNFESPRKLPCRPWRSRKLGFDRRRPHHLSVITFNGGSPSEARRSLIWCPPSSSIVCRVHVSAARAVSSASGTCGCGFSTGYHSLKKASESVTRSSAPGNTRRIASPRSRCASSNRNPSTSSPSQAATSSAESCSSSPLRGRPVSQSPSSRRSAGRSAAKANTCPASISCSAPVASSTARPGNSSGAVAEHRPVRQLARGRAPGAEAEHEPTRALRCEPIEVRRLGDLVRCAPAERVVRSVGEPVEEDDEDRVHGGVRLQARRASHAGPVSCRRPKAVAFVERWTLDPGAW